MNNNNCFINKAEYKRLKNLGYTDMKIAKIFGVSSGWIKIHKKELIA